MKPARSLVPFEHLHALSHAMVQAARENDWDALAAYERDLAAARDRLIAAQVGGDMPEPTEPAALARKAELLRDMLAHDSEIRQLVEPWMDSTRKLLAGGARGRAAARVRAAYGGHGPR
ncbi:flagellar protein FliT [Rhodocyclaceae bacterium SMB388]